MRARRVGLSVSETRRAEMAVQQGSTAALRRLIEAAMELERRTMNLYCVFESQFSEREELRGFWFDMAQHESRHFGALALVVGLLESASKRSLRTATAVTPARIQHLRRLLTTAAAAAGRGVS